MTGSLKIAIAQIAPVWLDREQTIEKMVYFIRQAASEDASLVMFGEAILPGYSFWLEHTDAARFDSPFQKSMYAHYIQESVQIERGDLNPICEVAQRLGIQILTGIVERPLDRGNHSLYCSLVFIDSSGKILNVHRKLMPTYEERLVWAQGDGFGLQTFSTGPFTLGALNCWENWMPLARSVLYAQGENLHIGLWPGNLRNTQMLTPVIAQESRSYSVGVCGIMRASDIPEKIPYSQMLKEKLPTWMADGGSCVANPDGSWLIEPFVEEEKLLFATLNLERVLEERQNFDPSGHYSRPDVFQLSLNSKRQGILKKE